MVCLCERDTGSSTFFDSFVLRFEYIFLKHVLSVSERECIAYSEAFTGRSMTLLI